MNALLNFAEVLNQVSQEMIRQALIKQLMENVVFVWKRRFERV